MLTSIMEQLPDTGRDYDFDEVMETFRKDGSLLRAKARIILEERFIPEAYRRLGDEQLATSAVVDIAKLLVDIGDVKPKTSNTPTAQTGFSISIVLPSPSNPDSPVTIEATATPVTEEADELLASLPEPEDVMFNTPAMDFVLGDGCGPRQEPD